MLKNTDNTEYRIASWEADKDEKRIVGYAVVFDSRTVIYKDPCSGIESGEVIDRNALSDTDMSDVVLRYNHTGRVLARTRNGSLKLTVDSHGLKIEADMTQSDEAKSLYKDVQSGLVDKMSFAFTVAADGEEWNASTRTRTITKIDKLFDVALVDFPAYDTTEVYARAKALIEPEVKSINLATVSKIQKRADDLMSKFGLSNITPDYYSDDFELTDSDKIFKEMTEVRSDMLQHSSCIDVAYTEARFNELKALENKLLELEAEKRAVRMQIANGTVPTKLISKMETKPMENRTYIDELVEKRSAAGTSGMSNVIPQEVVGDHIREGKNGLFDLISYTNISNGGSVKIPYIADSDMNIAAHTENAAITPDGTVPNCVTITHGELQQTIGYSYLGKQIAASQLETMINNALFSGMRLKLDAACITAIKALTWVKTSGDTQNAVQWATSGSPKIGEIITLMKLLPQRYASDAVLVMSRATQLSIVENSTGLISSTGSNGMYNFDLTSGLTTMLGVPVVIDSNMSAGDILYGNPRAVHLNIAGDVFLHNWLDHDSLTEKMQIACAAGAATETASFVLGANSIA